MQVSYEARKVAGGFIPYTVVNLAISGVLVRLISKLNWAVNGRCGGQVVSSVGWSCGNSWVRFLQPLIYLMRTSIVKLFLVKVSEAEEMINLSVLPGQNQVWKYIFCDFSLEWRLCSETLFWDIAFLCRNALNLETVHIPQCNYDCVILLCFTSNQFDHIQVLQMQLTGFWTKNLLKCNELPARLTSDSSPRSPRFESCLVA